MKMFSASLDLSLGTKSQFNKKRFMKINLVSMEYTALLLSCVSPNPHQIVSIFTNPPLRQNMTQGQFLSSV